MVHMMLGSASKDIVMKPALIVTLFAGYDDHAMARFNRNFRTLNLVHQTRLNEGSNQVSVEASTTKFKELNEDSSLFEISSWQI